MGTVSNFPFDPILNPTWVDIKSAATPGFVGQKYSSVLDTLKFDSSATITPLQTPAQIGAIWSNTVDDFIEVAWPAIVQVLTGTGAATFIGLGDTPGASGTGPPDYKDFELFILRINAGGTGIEYAATIPHTQVLDGTTDGDGTKRFFVASDVTDLIETREPAHTGVLTWTAPGMSVISTTVVRFHVPLTAVRIDRNGLTVTGRTDMNLAVQTDFVVTIPTTRPGTWFTLDDAGAIQEYLTPPAQSILDQEAFLGVSIHDATGVTGVITAPDVSGGLYKLLQDEIRASVHIKIDSGGDVDEKAVFQSILRTTDLFGIGINFVNDPINLNILTIPEADPGIFDVVFADGSVHLSAQTTLPKLFESAPGVASTYSGAKRCSINRYILLANGRIQVQLGKVEYLDYKRAAEAITDDFLGNPIPTIARVVGVVLAVVIIERDESDWAADKARILTFFGGAGGGVVGITPSLGDLTDVVLTTPAEGDGIFFDGVTTWVNKPVPFQHVFQFDGNVAAATDVALPLHIVASKLVPLRVHLEVKNPPSILDLEVDVLSSGTTIFPGAVATVLIAQSTGVETPNVTPLLANAPWTINIDQSDVFWSDLTVTIEGYIVP